MSSSTNRNIKKRKPRNNRKKKKTSATCVADRAVQMEIKKVVVSEQKTVALQTLERKKLEFVGLLAKYETVIEECNQKIGDENKKFLDMDIEIGKLPELKKQHRGWMINEYNMHIDEYKKQLKTICENIKRRSENRGETPVLSNKRIVELENQCKKCEENIRCINIERNNIESLQRLQYKRSEYWRNIHVNIEKIKKGPKNKAHVEIDKIKMNIREVDSQLLEETLRPRYIAYAKNYGLEYDKDDSFDLFRVCNNNHNLNLLNGYRAFSRICYKSGRECRHGISSSLLYPCIYGYDSDDGYDSDEEDNNNYVIIVHSNSFSSYGSCGCGSSYWNHEDPPENLLDFDLDTAQPCGEVEFNY